MCGPTNENEAIIGICGPTNENEALIVYVDPLMKMKQ